MWAELALGAYQAYSASQAARDAEKGQAAANDKQMAFNADEAYKQRTWEENMAKTKYQWTRKDLEAAGYNPLMALGVNPSVPSGASASATPQSTTRESSAIRAQSALNAASILKLNSETALNKAMAGTQGTQQMLNLANIRRSDYDVKPKFPGSNITLQDIMSFIKSTGAKHGLTGESIHGAGQAARNLGRNFFKKGFAGGLSFGDQ